ncbi:MAG: hypothetical protein IJ446_11185 [Oscillospiraceae bacterium]|nr:hypothetical protein [Oscillospiraceae bacterium]
MMDNLNSKITRVAEEAAQLCSPFQIFLVSQKSNSKGELVSFKLCAVVSDETDAAAMETKLLMNIDCDVPCDFIVYNVTDWNDCIDDDCSFAYRIDNQGVLLYGTR